MPTAAATRRARYRALDLFSIEPGEARPTLLLTLYLLLGIASVVILKAASTSLFLARFEARGLPFVYATIAVLAGFVVTFYLKLSVRLPQNRLILYTQLFSCSNLVLVWWLLRLRLDWMPAILYVWTGVYTVLIPSQVWALANQIFTTRQARRVFAVVGSGGILGAALGGLFTRQLLRSIQTPDLLLVCVGLLLCCAAIVTYMRRTARMPAAAGRSRQPAPTSLLESLRAIRGSRHLAWMTALVVLSAVLNGLVDYQFKSIVRQEISDRDQMTAFFAGVAGYLALLGLAMQLILTSRVMRWFGLNFAVFVLPLSMMLGSTVLLFSAGLLAAVLIKGLDGAFRHSIDRSATELLYMPLPVQLKQQAKSFIDLVASRSADALAAGLLFLLVYGGRFSAQQISWVNLAIIIPWLVAAWMLRREYLNALRSSIERKDISAEALLMQLAGSAASEEITATLASSNDRAVEAGLGLLDHGQAQAAHAQLASLLTHPSPAIRRKAMEIVTAKDVPGCAAEVGKFLMLELDVESLWQGFDYLERHEPGQFASRLTNLLESPYAVLRGAAAARLILAGGSPPHRAREVFDAFVESSRQDPNHRKTAARLLGLAPGGLDGQRVLAEFLLDADSEVARAAAISAGRTRQLDLVPRLIELAGDRKIKMEARQALAAFGPDILPRLEESLRDARLSPRIRRNLPRVFSWVGGQQAADQLAINLEPSDGPLQYQTLRALGRMRLRQPEVHFDPQRITPLIVRQLERYYWIVGARQTVPSNSGPASAAFLRRALDEHLNRKLDVIFRLIGLLYPPKPMLDAYYGINSGRRDLRANAVEFLDTLLVNPVRQMLLPILEGSSAERILEQGRSWSSQRPSSYPEALSGLMAEPDPWLQSCAVYAAADQKLPGLAALLEPLARSDDGLLQETVEAVQRRLGRAVQPASSPGAVWKP